MDDFFAPDQALSGDCQTCRFVLGLPSAELQRVLFTQDDDLLSEAANRIRENVCFYGVIYTHQLRVSIGTCVNELEIIAQAGETEDNIGRV